jgi:hypothetical protein
VKPSESNRVMPLQNIIAPSVVMNEGMRPLTVTSPFRRPAAAPKTRTTTRTRNRFTPAWNRRMKMKEQKTRIEPTERSNSPQIIKRPTPSTTMQNSDPSASRMRRFSGLAKRRSGERKVDSTARPTNTSSTLEER